MFVIPRVGEGDVLTAEMWNQLADQVEQLAGLTAPALTFGNDGFHNPAPEPETLWAIVTDSTVPSPPPPPGSPPPPPGTLPPPPPPPRYAWAEAARPNRAGYPADDSAPGAEENPAGPRGSTTSGWAEEWNDEPLSVGEVVLIRRDGRGKWMARKGGPDAGSASGSAGCPAEFDAVVTARLDSSWSAESFLCDRRPQYELLPLQAATRGDTDCLEEPATDALPVAAFERNDNVVPVGRKVRAVLWKTVNGVCVYQFDHCCAGEESSSSSGSESSTFVDLVTNICPLYSDGSGSTGGGGSGSGDCKCLVGVKVQKQRFKLPDGMEPVGPPFCEVDPVDCCDGDGGTGCAQIEACPGIFESFQTETTFTVTLASSPVAGGDGTIGFAGPVTARLDLATETWVSVDPVVVDGCTYTFSVKFVRVALRTHLQLTVATSGTGCHHAGTYTLDKDETCAGQVSFAGDWYDRADVGDTKYEMAFAAQLFPC